MPLIACPDCATEVSLAAPACPKCARPIAARAPRRGMSPWLKWPLGIGGGLILLAMVSPGVPPEMRDARSHDGTEPAACTIAHWTWSNASLFVKLEGVVDPPGRRELFIQGFDEQGNLIGVKSTHTEPDGQFTALLGSGPNPSPEMTLKYSCR